MTSSRADTAPAAPKLTYQPAFDSLRGLGMMAMLVYHATGTRYFRGAIFALSMFFTLSGFLIATLLFQEVQRTDRVNYIAFWGRRFRRLLPAALLALLMIALFAVTVATPEQLQTLRGDALSALFYTSNIRFIALGRSYAAAFSDPSPVQPFWSLSLEEQFYLVLPWLLVAIVHMVRRHWDAVVRWFVVLACLCSAWMIVLHIVGASTDRVYYAPDTRFGEFFFGVALAALRHSRGGFPEWMKVWAKRFGLVALAAEFVAWWTFDLDNPLAYRGGLTLHALFTCVVIVALMEDAPMTKVLAARPLVYLGRISYGLYLYNWPIVLWLTAERTHLDGWPLVLVRIAAVFPVAIASYHLVEKPIRYGAWGRSKAISWIGVGSMVAVAGLLIAATWDPPAPRVSFERVTSGEVANPKATVMVVGDSLANNIARGMAGTHADRVSLVDRSRPGCGLAVDERRTEARWVPLDAKCRPTWETQFPADVKSVRPNVVVAMFGGQDTWDQRVNGVVVPFDSDAGKRLRERHLSDAVDDLSAGGAHVVLLTTPAAKWVGWGAGAIEDQSRSVNNPRWIALWNDSLRTVARRSGGRATVVDANAFLSPGNRFTTTVDGVKIREFDGIHLSRAGQHLFAQWLWPRLDLGG